MKNGIKIFLTFIVLINCALFSQEKSYFAELVPPSPDVAQLGQYGTTQIGKYTGTARVNVPLHTINLDGMQIPIELTYQTGGIKVAQEASWTGLGWNLSANAVITRQINSYDDLVDGEGAVGYLFSPVYDFDNLTTAQETVLFNAYQNMPHDTEPDLFTASIFGESVQFILPKKGSGNMVEAIILNNKVVKVYYYVSTKTFKVLNGQGYEFNFGSATNDASKEFTTTYRSDGSNAFTDYNALTNSIAYQSADNGRTWQKLSAWHVDDVTAPSGRTISFTYQKASYFGYPSFYESYDFNMCAGNNTQNGIGYKDYDVDSSKKVGCTITGFQAVQLNLISGDFGTVDFTLSSREDISFRYQTPSNNFSSVIPLGNPIKRLNGITVKNSLNQTIKNITLDQTYFNSDQSTDTGSYKKEKYMRLKLDGVTINDQEYTFDYIQPNDVPAKDSKDEDFWGFYNGKGNTSRMPSFGRLTLCNVDRKEYFFNLTGANRGADITYGKIGLLSKVTYPTKGSAEFEYEANEALVDKPTQAGYSNPYSNSADLSYNYQYIKRTLTDGYQTSLNAGDTFQITSAGTLPFAYNFTATASVYCAGQCNGVVDNLQNVIEVEKLDSPGAGTIHKIPYFTSTSGQGASIEQTVEWSLPNGTYKLTKPFYTIPPGGAFLSSTIVSAYFLDDPAVTPFPWEEFEVGGARIKSVTNKDANGSFISKKEYVYEESNLGQIVSTGRLMNQLVYHSKYGFLDYTPQDFLSVFAMGSGNQLSLDFSAQGSHVGYSYVTEKEVTSTGVAKGKILTAYENLPNEFLTYYVGTTPLNNSNGIVNGGLSEYDVHYGNAYLIGVPPNSYSYKNGNVLWETVEDDSFNTLTRTDNTYFDYLLDLEPVYKAYFSPGGLVADISYDQTGNAYLPNTNEAKSYFGNDVATTTTTSTYELLKFLPRSIEKTTSKTGVVTKEEMYYPFDAPAIVGSDTFLNELINENRITDPILTRIYQDSVKLTETKFKFANFSGKYWRSEVLEAKGTESLTQRMAFDSYDTLGNLEEYRLTDGPHISYIWGYNQQYPVAKIENATRAQVESALGVDSNYHTGSGGLSASQETTLRNALPNAMVSTYTYDPLVGVTSMTDPRGYKMTYHYDAFNRLEFVKDADGNLISENKYNYKDQ